MIIGSTIKIKEYEFDKVALASNLSMTLLTLMALEPTELQLEFFTKLELILIDGNNKVLFNYKDHLDKEKG